MLLTSVGFIFLYIFLGIIGLILLLVLLIIGGISLIYFNPLIFVKKFMRKSYTREELLKQVMYPTNYDEVYKDKADIKINLVYSDMENSTYDLYLPKNINHKVPLIIWIHGGAFVAGEKDGIFALGNMLASDNYATLAINYRLAPENSFFDMAKQISLLMEHVIETYKDSEIVDINKIIMAGDSAGGHILLSYVLTQFNKEYSEKLNIESKYKDYIKGLLLLCNPYDLVILAKQNNKKLKFFVNAFSRKYFRQGKWKKDLGNLGTFYNFVTSDFPPCYLTDGNKMSFGIQSKKFKNVLEQQGIYNESLYFDDVDHVVNHEYNFELHTEEAMINYQKMLEFIEKVLNK